MKMVAEITLENLNKIADYVTDLQERFDNAITILNERKEKCEDISWVEMRTESYLEECDEIINTLKGDGENEER